MKNIQVISAIACFALVAPCVQAQSSGSFAFGKKTAGPAATEVVEVYATGNGADVDSARKDAVRNAIKMAVGELVGSKTLVENDELVEDTILTLSNAVVEKTEPIGEPMKTGDGLVKVKIKALVKKGQLNQELEKVGVSNGAVAGESLAATLFSGRERVANAEKFLAERFKGFPGNVVEAVMLTKADGSPDIEVDTGSGHVFANVGVQVNMENYAKFTQALCELLGQICLEKEETNFSFEEKKGKYPPNYVFEGEKVMLKSVPKAYPVIVATPAAKKVSRTSWPATIYYLDAQMFTALSQQIGTLKGQSGHVQVVFKDEDEESVCSKWADIGIYEANYPVMSDQFPMCLRVDQPVRDDTDFCLFAPVLENQGGRYNSSFTYNREMDPTRVLRIDLGKVEEDDLASVVGYEVKVEYR